MTKNRLITFSFAIFFTCLFASISFGESGYGLPVGTKAPAIIIEDVNGKMFSLEESIKNAPVVVVFYRGGWCMYCNTQLRDLQESLVPTANKYNAQIIAVSVDRHENSLKTVDSDKLSFIVASDPEAKTLGDYNVQYKVPPELYEKYLSYKIDLESASGEKHHIIAVPAVFVVDKSGTIIYSYANEDYKIRANVEDVKKAIVKAASSDNVQ